MSLWYAWIFVCLGFDPLQTVWAVNTSKYNSDHYDWSIYNYNCIIVSIKVTHILIQHTTNYSQHTAQQNMSNIVSMQVSYKHHMVMYNNYIFQSHDRNFSSPISLSLYLILPSPPVPAALLEPLVCPPTCVCLHGASQLDSSSHHNTSLVPSPLHRKACSESEKSWVTYGVDCMPQCA